MKTDKSVSGNYFLENLIFCNIMLFVAIVMMILGICLSHNRHGYARLGELYLLFGFVVGVVGFFFWIGMLVERFRKRKHKIITETKP